MSETPQCPGVEMIELTPAQREKLAWRLEYMAGSLRGHFAERVTFLVPACSVAQWARNESSVVEETVEPK